MIEYGGEITPEGRARMEKYGSTLSARNVQQLCERIADYPEVITAVLEALAADADKTLVKAVAWLTAEGVDWFDRADLTTCLQGIAAVIPTSVTSPELGSA